MPAAKRLPGDHGESGQNAVQIERKNPPVANTSLNSLSETPSSKSSLLAGLPLKSLENLVSTGKGRSGQLGERKEA